MKLKKKMENLRIDQLLIGERDSIDEDMEDLDKAVEFGKLVSLQPTRFLDVT